PRGLALLRAQPGAEGRRRLVRAHHRPDQRDAAQEPARSGRQPESPGAGSLRWGGSGHPECRRREDAGGAESRQEVVGDRALRRGAARIPRRLSSELSRDAGEGRLAAFARVVPAERSRLMRFGLFGSAQAKRGGPDVDSGAGFREFVENNVKAEALGYVSSFVVEHHFTGFGQISATLNLLTWVGARTKTLRLGTAVITLPWHNPVLLAEQVATMDLLSNGRLDFGI